MCSASPAFDVTLKYNITSEELSRVLESKHFIVPGFKMHVSNILYIAHCFYTLTSEDSIPGQPCVRMFKYVRMSFWQSGDLPKEGIKTQAGAVR